MCKGGKTALDEDGNPVFEPGLINFKELLECEDPKEYLGSPFVSYFDWVCMHVSLSPFADSDLLFYRKNECCPEAYE